MRMGLATVALLLALSPGPAEAGLSRAALETVGVTLPPGARLDMSLSAPDAAGTRRTLQEIADGRPMFLNFVDYTCHTLCGTDLMLLADGIRRAGLSAGDFHIVVIGIDPKDTASDAVKMEDNEIPPNLRAASVFLLLDKKTLARAAQALGFNFVYDEQTDQFAHPAIVYAIGPDGAVRALLSPLSLTAGDMKRALQGPSTLSFSQRIHALCYGYDPVTGIYTPRISFLLQLAAIATLLTIAAGLAFLSRTRRRA